MYPDLGAMTMTEIIRLQDLFSKELARRFEHELALAFSDIVGSTPYFVEHGDEAGRRLQQRHFDLVEQALHGREGSRIVDTAGDGAFLCFPRVEDATDVIIDFQKNLLQDNASRPAAHQLQVRVGIHFGRVLTDGVQVAGEAVNLCARLAQSASSGEIRLTRDAFHALHDGARRLLCVPTSAATLKGIPRPVDVMRLEWLDRQLFPDRVRIVETNEEVPLSPHATISFGRMSGGAGIQGNDVVLALPDPMQAKQISRWHFELRRLPSGLVLRQLSDQVTEVDGSVVPKGTEAPVRRGAVVKIGRVMTLIFESSTFGRGAGSEATFAPPM